MTPDAALPRLRDYWAAARSVRPTPYAVDPPGDVVMADIAREALSPVLDRLTDMGLAREGSIAVESVDTSLSHHATRAQDAAPGLSEDALVWHEVVDRTEAESRTSLGYLALMALATTIGMIGVLFDQPILVVGAMVTGPDFGPLAAISVGVVGRRWRTAGRAAATLAAGFGINVAMIVAGAVLCLVIQRTWWRFQGRSAAHPAKATSDR